MATVNTHAGTLAMTSGNRVAVSNIRNPSLFETFEIPSVGGEKLTKKDDEDSATNTAAGDGDSLSSSLANRVLACGFSGQGQYFAVCDDLKMLHVYRATTVPWTLLSSRLLARRATSLTFTLDESTVLVADKSGDVYAFPTVTEVKDEVGPEVKTQGQLLLGHLSMILDVCLADGEKFVVTCDRDEKIRLSHYPNSYNIQTYCLGHSQFVSCLTYVEECGVLISGSGDCSLRVWNMQGKQLCLARCPVNRSADAVASPQMSSANLQQSNRDDFGEKNGDENEEKTTNEREKIAIQGMTFCKQCRLLVVSFYSYPGLLAYSLSVKEEETSLTLIQTIPLQRHPWDVTFDDSSNTLWVLSPVEGRTLSAFVIKENNGAENVQLIGVEEDGSQVSELLKTVNSKWDFFLPSTSVASTIPTLWKTCTQDQVTEYQQRKQQRLQGNAKDTQGPKDQKDRQEPKDRQGPKNHKGRQGPKDQKDQKAGGDASVSGVPEEDLPEKKPRVS